MEETVLSSATLEEAGDGIGESLTPMDGAPATGRKDSKRTRSLFKTQKVSPVNPRKIGRRALKRGSIVAGAAAGQINKIVQRTAKNQKVHILNYAEVNRAKQSRTSRRRSSLFPNFRLAEKYFEQEDSRSRWSGEVHSFTLTFVSKALEVRYQASTQKMYGNKLKVHWLGFFLLTGFSLAGFERVDILPQHLPFFISLWVVCGVYGVALLLASCKSRLESSRESLPSIASGLVYSTLVILMICTLHSIRIGLPRYYLQSDTWPAQAIHECEQIEGASAAMKELLNVTLFESKSAIESSPAARAWYEGIRRRYYSACSTKDIVYTLSHYPRESYGMSEFHSLSDVFNMVTIFVAVVFVIQIKMRFLYSCIFFAAPNVLYITFVASYGHSDATSIAAFLCCYGVPIVYLTFYLPRKLEIARRRAYFKEVYVTDALHLNIQQVKRQKLSLKAVKADLDRKKKDFSFVKRELKAYKNEMDEAGQSVVNDMMEKSEAFRKTLSMYNTARSEIIMQKQLGAGTFGQVWQGQCCKIECAIKTMRSSSVTQMDAERFRSEIELMAKLQENGGGHPNVVQLMYCCYEKELMICLEFCRVGSIEDIGAKALSSPPFSRLLTWNRDEFVGDDSFAVLTRYALEISAGMQHIHNLGIIHRDLKPGNVLLQGSPDDLPAEWQCKISDFGESRELDVGHTMTQTGTPFYVAPEVMKMEAYGNTADIFSFGMLLLDMATFSQGGLKACWSNTIFTIPRLINGARPWIPDNVRHDTPWLVELIVQCWDNDPEKRPASFRDINATITASGTQYVPIPRYIGSTQERARKSVLSNFSDIDPGRVQQVIHFRSKLASQGVPVYEYHSHILGDVNLYCILMEHHFDEEKSSEWVRTCLVKRKTYGCDEIFKDIIDNDIPFHALPGTEQLKEAGWHHNQWLCTSADGDIVTFERWGGVNVSKLFSMMPAEEYQRWELYRNEWRCWLMNELSYKAMRIVKYCNIIDFHHIKFAHRKLMHHWKILGGLGDAHWTGCVMGARSFNFAVGCSTVVKTLYEMMSSFLNERQKETTRFFGSNPTHDEDFLNLFGRKRIPHDLGGTLRIGPGGLCCGVELPRPSQTAEIWRRYQKANVVHYDRCHPML